MRTLTICNQDIARYTIVLSPTPAPAETTAAEFLQKVIATACGVTLPISDTGEYAIRIGTREPSPEVKWDGFRITTDERNVYLDGNIPRGTLYATYDFAEKYLAYRMFSPDCEVIPTDGTAEIPTNLNLVDNPSFEVRRLDSHHLNSDENQASHARLNSCTVGDMEQYGGIQYSYIACHSVQTYCPAREYGESHPEYYALVNGVRENHPEGQLCFSNPDVLRVVTERVLRELRAKPDTTLLDFSQMDFTLGCTCEHCAAIDEEEGSQSGSMIRFVNALAEAVEKEFPNVMIQTFAYEYTTKPPKVTKARENIIVRYCTYNGCFRHPIDDLDCPLNSETLYREIMGWREMSSHMSIWNYV